MTIAKIVGYILGYGNTPHEKPHEDPRRQMPSLQEGMGAAQEGAVALLGLLEDRAMSLRAVVRHAKYPHEIFIDGKTIGFAIYELGVDDWGGNGICHTHNDLGHCWPMTGAELRALRDQITALLRKATS